MAFTHVFTTTIEPLSFFDGGGSTGPIDTRGCDLIVFVIAANFLSGPFCSDNQGNHYFHDLNPGVLGGGYSGIKNVQTFSTGPTDHYAAPLNTSAAHVFTLAGGTYAQSCIIYGFSGVDSTDPLDISGLGTSKDTSLTPLADYLDADTITPSLNGNLIVTGCTFGLAQSVIADDPFNGPLERYFFSAGVHYGNAATFLVRSPAAVATPRWASVLTPGPLAATVTVFNVAVPGGDGGGGAPVPGGEGDAAGWFDTPRFIDPRRLAGSAFVSTPPASPPGIPVPPPPETPDTNYILTEAGDIITTEAGDPLITES